MRIPTSALWLSAATGAAMMVIAWAALGQPVVSPTDMAPPPGMMMMAPPSRPPTPSRGMLCEDHDAFLAGALAFARTKLAITEQQANAWEKFAASAKAASEPLRQLCASDQPPPRSAALPERLERRERVEAARLDGVKRIRPAVAELYETLSPEQRAAADRLSAMRLPM